MLEHISYARWILHHVLKFVLAAAQLEGACPAAANPVELGQVIAIAAATAAASAQGSQATAAANVRPALSFTV